MTAPADFAVSLTFDSDRTVVAIRGELTFIDASGLRQVARVLADLRTQRGGLTIVSPSAMTYKILKLTGFTELLNIDLPVPTRPATSPRESLRRAWPDQAPGPGVFPGRSWGAVTTIPLQYENRRAAL